MKDSGQSRPLVLVVDQRREVLDEITTVLGGADFSCRCCTTAEEAIAAAETDPPDLIVCDLNLHGENGLDTCRRIKRRPGMENVPVMLLSGAQLPDVIRRSHPDGCIYCLRKPPAPKVFIELIDQALGTRISASRMEHL